METGTGSEPDKTDFGFRVVPLADKVKHVGKVFDSVASKYDLMNDLMSLGTHRLWKRFALDLSGVRAGQQVLDVASGTGDMAAAFARKVGSSGQVISSDINASMLTIGRGRLLDRGIHDNIHFVQGNAECLPFPPQSFDVVCIAFGLRNVTDKSAALRAMGQALKPGGRLIVLEFSKPVIPLLAQIYDRYSFSLLPKLGKLIADDEDSYRYLVESIRKHPDQQTLKTMMLEAGLDQCDVHNLSGGIVAVHRGIRY